MAHAQDYCGDLKEVIAEATFGFDGLKDEENFEDNFEPYFYLSNAYSCWIHTEDVSVFACHWQFVEFEQFGAKLAQLDAATKACLAGWTRTDLSGKTSAEGRTIERGFRMDGSAANPTVFLEAFIPTPGERGGLSVLMKVSVR